MPRRKLTNEQIEEIKEKSKDRSLGWTLRLAEEYNISTQFVSNIANGSKRTEAKRGLTVEQVKEIKKLLREVALRQSDLTQDEIAKMFNISQATISSIKCGHKWKDVE